MIRYRYIFVFLLSVLALLTCEGKHYKHRLAVTAIFRDEARWLKEWIEFHHMMGATKFYLYNNLSQDHYRSVLQPYIDKGLVSLKQWPYESKNVEEWNRIQCSAYRDAIRRAKGKCQWLAVLDVDEFVVPIQHNNLLEFLSQYVEFGGVVIHWQMFGTSNIKHIPKDKLMIEMLVQKAPPYFPEHAFIKSIVQPDAVASMNDPHYAKYIPGKYQVNTHKMPVRNSNNQHFDLDWARIHHYWTRDEDWFWTRKCPRRETWGDGLDGQIQRKESFSTYRDTAMERFVPKLRKRMGLP